jgi:hypothetical protein
LRGGILPRLAVAAYSLLLLGADRLRDPSGDAAAAA